MGSSECSARNQLPDIERQAYGGPYNNRQISGKYQQIEDNIKVGTTWFQ